MISPDRRERRKQRTRDALVHAALALFASKGYERTAVHEITDAVDVSERTFFRYFASKEDLILSLMGEAAALLTSELAARPAREDPFTAMRNAHLVLLRRAAEETETISYLRVLRLVESTPALLSAQLRYSHERAEDIIRVLAEREGVDPVTDPRPRVLAAVVGSLMFLAIRDWQCGGGESTETMATAFDTYAAETIPALTGRWAARD